MEFHELLRIFLPSDLKFPIISKFDRLPMFVELILYVLLGVVWAFPLKFIFMGVGQKDPDA